MDTPKPVDAIHGKAIDLACEDDRIWFEQHPDRKYRLRDVVPYEFNGPLPAPPVDHTWRVIVAQKKPGVRLRAPIGLPKAIPNDGADDGHLAPMFAQFAPEQFSRFLEGE